MKGEKKSFGNMGRTYSQDSVEINKVVTYFKFFRFSFQQCKLPFEWVTKHLIRENIQAATQNAVALSTEQLKKLKQLTLQL